MPLTLRPIKSSGFYGNEIRPLPSHNDENALEETSFNSMLGCIKQLSLLANYSNEIFTNIARISKETKSRIDNLERRSNNLALNIDSIKISQNFKSHNDDTMPGKQILYSENLVERENLSNTFKSYIESEKIKRMPNYSVLDEFKSCFSHGDKITKIQFNYSNPNFFFERWFAEQEKRLANLKKARELQHENKEKRKQLESQSKNADLNRKTKKKNVVDWKERFMVNGVPVNQSDHNLRRPHTVPNQPSLPPKAGDEDESSQNTRYIKSLHSPSTPKENVFKDTSNSISDNLAGGPKEISEETSLEKHDSKHGSDLESEKDRFVVDFLQKLSKLSKVGKFEIDVGSNSSEFYISPDPLLPSDTVSTSNPSSEKSRSQKSLSSLHYSIIFDKKPENDIISARTNPISDQEKKSNDNKKDVLSQPQEPLQQHQENAKNSSSPSPPPPPPPPRLSQSAKGDISELETKDKSFKQKDSLRTNIDSPSNSVDASSEPSVSQLKPPPPPPPPPPGQSSKGSLSKTPSQIMLGSQLKPTDQASLYFSSFRNEPGAPSSKEDTSGQGSVSTNSPAMSPEQSDTPLSLKAQNHHYLEDHESEHLGSPKEMINGTVPRPPPPPPLPKRPFLSEINEPASNRLLKAKSIKLKSPVATEANSNGLVPSKTMGGLGANSSSLLEAIRGGAKLRKVDMEEQMKKKKEAASKNLGLFSNSAVAAILERRKYLESANAGDDDDDDEDEDEDDWD